jgi:outer membrane protein assembly factor BamB
MNKTSLLSAFALSGFIYLGFAADDAQAQWPDRHGPSLDGHVAAKDLVGLPTTWNENENIAWKAPLHDEGHSSPVIQDGRVWLTAATKDGKKQYILCIDEVSGKVIHDKLLFENEEVEELGGAVGFNNYAAPSCVAASGAIYVHFGSYGTARLDSKTAEVIWQRRDLKCRHFRGPGSSPVLLDDKLILTFDGVDYQYTTALDAETGDTIWSTPRSTEYGDLDEDGKPKRDGDMRKAYCTPGYAKVGERVQLLSVGSRAMQSYDLATGKELWTLRHSSYNAGIRPLWLPEHNLALINTGSRGAELVAVRLDETTLGDITDSHVQWVHRKGNPRFSMPVYDDGLVYQINDLGVVVCIDVTTGEEVWKGRAAGNYRASPILAGDKLYFFAEDGLGTILRTGRNFERIGSNKAEALGTTACPAVSDGAIFVRGKTHLYKISSN